jgi:hypothetical protein
VTSRPAAARSDRPTVFFHVGAPKTGTTYLQQVMYTNRDRLRRDGVLYPGPQVGHFFASQDLRNAAFRDFPDPHVPGAWRRLVGEIRTATGGRVDRAIIDHESFGTATRPQISRALEDLSFAEVHIVYTARDLARQLPAVWQERIKNRSTQTWTAFLASVQADRPSRSDGVRQFWKNHDVARVLRRWSEALPPEQVHIVTVPPSGSDHALLWRRFAGLLGVDPTGYVTDVPKGVNASLGAAEAAVLRRFNEAIVRLDVPWPAYAAVFKQEVAPTLAQRSARIEVPEDVYDWTVDWSKHLVAELVAAGYDVVGDLDELIPGRRPTGIDPDNVPGDAFGDAAIAGMVSLLEVVLESPLAATAMRRAQRGAMARWLEDLAHRSKAVAALRDAYRRWR